MPRLQVKDWDYLHTVEDRLRFSDSFKKPPTKPQINFLEHIPQMYKYIKSGYTEDETSLALGEAFQYIKDWKKRHPVMKEILREWELNVV